MSFRYANKKSSDSSLRPVNIVTRLWKNQKNTSAQQGFDSGDFGSNFDINTQSSSFPLISSFKAVINSSSLYEQAASIFTIGVKRQIKHRLLKTQQQDSIGDDIEVRVKASQAQTPTSSPSKNQKQPSNSTFQTTAYILGISVGVLLFLILLVCVLHCALDRRRRGWSRGRTANLYVHGDLQHGFGGGYPQMVFNFPEVPYQFLKLFIFAPVILNVKESQKSGSQKKKKNNTAQLPISFKTQKIMRSPKVASEQKPLKVVEFSTPQNPNPDTDYQQIPVKLLQPRSSISPLTPTQSSSLPTNTSQPCSICLDQFDPSSLIKYTFCGHLTHSKCLDDWFYKWANCPLCRENFDYNGVRNYQNKIMLAMTVWNKDQVEKLLNKELQQFERYLVQNLGIGTAVDRLRVKRKFAAANQQKEKVKENQKGKQTISKDKEEREINKKSDLMINKQEYTQQSLVNNDTTENNYNNNIHHRNEYLFAERVDDKHENKDQQPQQDSKQHKQPIILNNHTKQKSKKKVNFQPNNNSTNIYSAAISPHKTSSSSKTCDNESNITATAMSQFSSSLQFINYFKQIDMSLQNMLKIFRFYRQIYVYHQLNKNQLKRKKQLQKVGQRTELSERIINTANNTTLQTQQPQLYFQSQQQQQQQQQQIVQDLKKGNGNVNGKENESGQGQKQHVHKHIQQQQQQLQNQNVKIKKINKIDKNNKIFRDTGNDTRNDNFGIINTGRTSYIKSNENVENVEYIKNDHDHDDNCVYQNKQERQKRQNYQLSIQAQQKQQQQQQLQQQQLQIQNQHNDNKHAYEDQQVINDITRKFNQTAKGQKDKKTATSAASEISRAGKSMPLTSKKKTKQQPTQQKVYEQIAIKPMKIINYLNDNGCRRSFSNESAEY